MAIIVVINLKSDKFIQSEPGGRSSRKQNMFWPKFPEKIKKYIDDENIFNEKKILRKKSEIFFEWDSLTQFIFSKKIKINCY